MFYTYAHLRESDGRVFYIGKGHGRRAWSQSERGSWWAKTRSKHGLRIEVLARWESESEAFEHERLLISTFRDLGHPLVNLTDGGEGFAGGKHTSEWKASMSARMKGRPGVSPSAEVRERLRAIAKANPPKHWLGKKHSPESIAKRTASRIATAPKYEEGGLRMSLTQWAEYLQMHRSSIDYRIKTGKPLLAPKYGKGGVS